MRQNKALHFTKLVTAAQREVWTRDVQTRKAMNHTVTDKKRLYLIKCIILIVLDMFTTLQRH